MRGAFPPVRLCVLVTSAMSPLPLDKLVREVIAGGADCIQLREKTISDREFLDAARRCREAAGDTVFIVNDRADIALLSGADGVHVGQGDLPARLLRGVVGDDLFIGVSTSSEAEMLEAEADEADYLGVGCVFPTSTKDTHVEGLTVVEAAARLSKLPFLAIGGINADNVGEVIRAGAPGVAVSSAVISSGDPRSAAAKIRGRIEEALR